MSAKKSWRSWTNTIRRRLIIQTQSVFNSRRWEWFPRVDIRLYRMPRKERVTSQRMPLTNWNGILRVTNANWWTFSKTCKLDHQRECFRRNRFLDFAIPCRHAGVACLEMRKSLLFVSSLLSHRKGTARPFRPQSLVAERQQRPSILQQEQPPLAYRHLRKTNSAEGKASKEQHNAFRQPAIGYSFQRVRWFRAVRPSRGVA